MDRWWLYKENGEPHFSHWEQIFKCRLECWQQTKINIISPSVFHIDRVGNGNDDISAEEHFKNLKTKRSSYFLLEL